jgi:hypothetical protein
MNFWVKVVKFENQLLSKLIFDLNIEKKDAKFFIDEFHVKRNGWLYIYDVVVVIYV